jgi:hypothetical protein
MQRSLDDSVLLCMNRPAQLVAGAGGHVLAGAASDIAVFEAGGRTIVACA